MCLRKCFLQEGKEAAACGTGGLSLMQSLPPARDFVFLPPTSCSFKPDGLLCSLPCSGRECRGKAELESSLGVFHSHSDPRASVSSSQITLLMEGLSLFCFLSLHCQKSAKPSLLPVSIHTSGMPAQFKVCLLPVGSLGLQISLLYFKKIQHILENVALKMKILILRSMLQKERLK